MEFRIGEISLPQADLLQQPADGPNQSELLQQAVKRMPAAPQVVGKADRPMRLDRRGANHNDVGHALADAHGSGEMSEVGCTLAARLAISVRFPASTTSPFHQSFCALLPRAVIFVQ